MKLFLMILIKKEKINSSKNGFTFSTNFKKAAENCDVAFVCTPTHLHIETIKKFTGIQNVIFIWKTFF